MVGIGYREIGGIGCREIGGIGMGSYVSNFISLIPYTHIPLYPYAPYSQ
jgi:hypothetical protein